MSSYPQTIALPRRERSRELVSLPASLLLPNLTVVVLAVALFEVLFFGQGAQALFRDSDAGWHIRNGETIVESMLLPHVDPFSYTRQGATWFAWEWMADAAFGAAHRSAGVAGVALLSGIVIAVAAAGAARLALSLGADWFLTAGSMVLLL